MSIESYRTIQYKKELSHEDKVEIADKFVKSLDVIKQLGEVGKGSISYLKSEKNQEIWKNKLERLVGAADFFRGILKFVPGAPDEMMKKLGDFEKGLDGFGKKTMTSFEEMKSFIGEKTFFVKIVSPTLTLAKYMRSCTNYPGPESVINMQYAYAKKFPLQLAYDIKDYMQLDSISNPIKLAMNSGSLKTNADFEKWQERFCQVLGLLLLLEAFYSKYRKEYSAHNWNKIIEVTAEIFELISQLKAQFVKSEKYWEDVKDYLEKDIGNFTKRNRKEKADEIQKKLETYLTTDSFYIAVFLHDESTRRYAVQCFPHERQLIHRHNNDVAVLVYRSIRGNSMKQEDYDELEHQVKSCREGKLHYPQTAETNDILREIMTNQLLDTSTVRYDGLVMLVEKRLAIEHRSANCPSHEKGPGWWEDIEIATTKYYERGKKLLLVGFP